MTRPARVARGVLAVSIGALAWGATWPIAKSAVEAIDPLWLSALLTLYTGWDYFRAGVRHLIED